MVKPRSISIQQQALIGERVKLLSFKRPWRKMLPPYLPLNLFEDALASAFRHRPFLNRTILVFSQDKNRFPPSELLLYYPENLHWQRSKLCITR